ncbi:MAG: cytochrome b6 [bacterium]|nr:cytochrome b6 [bacterium]
MSQPENEKKTWEKVLEWLEKRISVRSLVDLITSFTGVLYGGLDKRLTVREAITKQMYKPVPGKYTWFACFGGISLILFMIQIVTGVLLAIYYRPSPDAAYDSIRLIMTEVPYGWLIRSIHRYAAELMVLAVFIHMFKVFMTGAYKPPRELNWVTGVFLMFLTLGFGFTGYLLPWDQTAYWASTVGTEMAQSVPLVGPFIAMILKGGTTIGEATLARFYAAHVIVLPWFAFFLLVAHFFMIRRQGCADPL